MSKSPRTLLDFLLRAADESPDTVAFRWKQDGSWRTLTYRQYLERARAAARAAAALGIRPGDRAALMMENRPEWATTYLGLACSGITVVPIDAKLQPGEVAHILRDSGAVAVFAGGRRWPVLQEASADQPALRHIALITADQPALFGGSGAEPPVVVPAGGSGAEPPSVCDLDALLAAHASDSEPDPFAAHPPTPDTIASILYTSGTTGKPKGAMLTHANFVAQVEGAFACFHVRRDDNFLLVLPLHHAFAFTANFVVPIAAQCEVSMVENLRTVGANMKEVHPSILLAVPLLAEKMLEVIQKKLSKNLFASILLRIGLSRIVGRGVVKSLGGRLRILICGGAASDPAMLQAYNDFGIHTIEGYGLTETAPICALTPESEIHLGTVGKALPGNGLLIDEPNDEGVGEICVTGPIVMKGYFHNDAATAESIQNGVFHTGDLGRLDANGYLTITGRKKSLIVNREGKNIYPEEVEQAINAAPHILESLVLGFHEGGEKAERVGAIAVPDMDRIEAESRRSRTKPSREDIEKLCLKELHEAVASIAEYKRPRKVTIRFEPFERTTTQKIKRYLYSISAE